MFVMSLRAQLIVITSDSVAICLSSPAVFQGKAISLLLIATAKQLLCHPELR